MIQQRRYNLLPVTSQVDVQEAGDDGTYQAGKPGVRFNDAGDGTVHDFHTGLQWVKTPHLMVPGTAGIVTENTAQAARGTWSAANDYIAGDVVVGDGAPDALFYVCILANGVSDAPQEPPNATYWVVTPWIGSAANLTTAATFGWVAGITAIEALDYAGFTDWRLANMFEMTSLYNNNTGSAPSILSPFSITSDVVFWTSSSRKTVTGSAYFANFTTAYAIGQQTKGNVNVVMPVRGGRLNA